MKDIFNESRKALREASGLFYLKEKVIFDKIELKDKLEFGKQAEHMKKTVTVKKCC